MKLHPASLAVGAALAVGVALLSAQQIVGSPAVEVRVVEMPIDQMRQLELVRHDGAHPRQFVEIVEGQSFTVPSDRLFVVTAIGTNNNDSWTQVLVGGTPVVTRKGNHPSGSLSLIELPRPGYACPASSIVEVTDGGTGGNARAWGYLTDL